MVHFEYKLSGLRYNTITIDYSKRYIVLVGGASTIADPVFLKIQHVLYQRIKETMADTIHFTIFETTNSS